MFLLSRLYEKYKFQEAGLPFGRLASFLILILLF
nr:MAG TPA: hypothetical protein [Caudoviricetes sp.]